MYLYIVSKTQHTVVAKIKSGLRKIAIFTLYSNIIRVQFSLSTMSFASINPINPFQSSFTENRDVNVHNILKTF